MTSKIGAAYPGGDDDRPMLAPRLIDALPPGAAAGHELTPLQVALRHKWMILTFALLMASAMYAALQFVSPTYVAQADVRIDMPQLRVTGGEDSLLRSEQPSAEQVRTEMAVLSSQRLAMSAVKALGLENLRAFQNCPAVSRLQGLRNLAGKLRGQPVPLPECTTSPVQAAKALLGMVSFGTDRGSFIIQISASAGDPDLAARLANGYADAYIAWQSELKASMAQQADKWLSADLADMRAQMLADDAAVEAYRQQHHLIALHAQSGATDGTVDTISTQRLEQRNSELSAIDATLSEKASVLAQVRQALAAGRLDAIPPVLNAALIQGLLARQADLSSNLEQLRANYGPTYPTVTAAAAALARNEAQIRVEGDKIVRSLSDEVAALTARKAAVGGHVDAVEQQVAGESRAAVDLSELQRTAETDRRLYENLFVRLKQVDAERRMAQANAAVVVEAQPPDVPAYPRKMMMVVGTFLTALGVGVGLAFAREMMSRGFRDTDQVEGEVGLPVIGIFARRRRAPQDIVIDQPMSVEAEAVHGVLTHLVGRPDPDGAALGRVVMVTSALPGEGKSCFTVALGRSAMRAGMSAFVLDCDLRRPMVQRLVAGGQRDTVPPLPGLDSGNTADLIVEVMRHASVDERSALRHLSLGDYVTNPHGLMAWPGLAGLLKYLRSRYDLVLLDTPPVLAVSDALKLGGLADDVVLAIDWSDTPREAVLAAVRALQRAQIAVTGLVMTKVDLRRYARSNAGEGFYLRHYRGYQRALDTAA
jgi:uncharacterized protein involved in exopolysaccharide biosynthesis/Mrp family chromosome partitioning ATPase